MQKNQTQTGFIKMMRAAEELFEKDPDAFMVLTRMSFCAKRGPAKGPTRIDDFGLEINQCLLGGHKSCNLSRRRYRDAQYRLEHIYKLAAFKGTNKGTIATFLSTDIYDINSQEENQQKGQQGANKRPSDESSPIIYKKIRRKEYINTNGENSENGGQQEIEPAGSMVADAPEQKVLKSSPSRKKEFSQPVKDLAADMLRDLVEANENYRPPGDLVPFMTQARLLLETDHYEHATVLEVLGYALSDTIIRGDFPGWHSIIYSKNPAYTLRKHFAKLSAASNCREKRRFAASSDDKRALEQMQEMNKLAL